VDQGREGRALSRFSPGICWGRLLRVDGPEVVGQHVGAPWLVDVQDHVCAAQGREYHRPVAVGAVNRRT